MLFEPAVGAEATEKRKTVQYRHDGLIVESVSQGALASPTKVTAEDSPPEASASFSGMTPGGAARPFKSKGCLLALERVIRKLDNVLVNNELGMPRGEWTITSSRLEGSVSLMAPSDLDPHDDSAIPYGFDLIPGRLHITLPMAPGQSSGRIEMRWIDALDSLYARDVLDWRADGGFSVRETIYFPGLDEVAISDSATSVVDTTSSDTTNSCRWVPRIGELVDDRRGDAAVRYRVGSSGELPSLTEIMESTIYEDVNPSGSALNLPAHDLKNIPDALGVSVSSVQSSLDLGELPFGDTPVRVPLFNEHEDYIGIVDLHADCGCINIHAESTSVDPGGLGHLNATVAVRSAGETERTIRLGYVVGATAEVVVHTITLRYVGTGALAVQPEQTYVGAQVAGSVTEVELRVLLPTNAPPEALKVTVSEMPLDFIVFRSGSQGQHWIRVRVPIPSDELGAVDLPVTISHDEVHSVSIVSCSVAPSQQTMVDWPAWRVPLSRLGSLEIQSSALKELEFSIGDEHEGLVLWTLPDRQGIGMRLEDDALLDGRIRAISLRTRLGPLRILLK